jgi:phosphate transport system substrate-binding protein
VNVSLVTRAAGVAAVAAVGLAACGGGSSGSSSASGGGGGGSSLTPQGSTFQQTIEQQWASDFGKQSGAKITYTGTGSSTGIAQFQAGKIPFAGSDVTMASDEAAAAQSSCGSQPLTLPITAGGVAIIYNLPGVTNLKLDAPTLAGIFMNKITKWNDPAIATLNPGAKLPSTAISTFHRADGSGTTDVLSGFLDATAKSVWTLGVNKQFSNWPGGQGATGSAGVVAGVKSTTGGITYAEVTYAKQNSLPTASIKGAGSSFVAISPATVAKSINSGFTVNSSDTGKDLAGTLSFTKMTGYPISTVSYVLVCSKYKSASTGTAVKSYLTYAAGKGQQSAAGLGFAPLPSALDSKVQASIASIS